MQTRSLLVQDTLFAYEGFGPDVSVELSYNSGAADAPSAFGNGWRLNMDQWLALGPSGVTISQGSGGNEFYPVSSTTASSGEVYVHDTSVA